MIGGIGSRIKWGIIITLVLGLGALAWHNQDLIEEKAKLAGTVLQQQTTLGEMEQQLKREAKLRKEAEQIAAQHKQEMEQVYEEAQSLREHIKKLEEQNEEVKEWADTDMPDSIVRAINDGLHNDTDSNED